MATAVTVALGRARAESKIGQADARAVFGPASAAFAVVLGAVIAVAMVRGSFAYAVDDAYIHITVARNVAFHGTWGLVPGVFESASSSPGWTVVLAAGLRVWPFSDELLPLALNVAAALWLLWSVSTLVTRACGPRVRTAWAVALSVPLVAGLVPLVLTGMEHTLHAAIVAQLLVLLQAAGTGTWTIAQRRAWYLLLTLGVFVRIETIFVGAAACAAVLVVDRARNHRQFRVVLTGLAVLGPIAVIAVLNGAAGGYLLPNSVIAKSSLANGTTFDAGRVITNMRTDPGFALAGALCLVVAAYAYRRRERGPALCALTVGLSVVGLELCGSVGVFGRYEAFAYLTALAVLGAYLVSGAVDFSRAATRRVTTCTAVLVLAPLVALLLGTPQAMSNINSQQAAMGRFLGEYYDGKSVAVNDIGEVAYRHRGGLIDFEGLGSVDVLEQRLNGTLDAPAVARHLAANDVEVVAVFERFYRPILPASLVPVGRWCLTEPVLVNSDRCVTWFATSAAGATALHSNLDAFEANLPPTQDLQLF